ncbi:MAG: HipA N-terminal domain-containing protein [Sphingomonas sp.]
MGYLSTDDDGAMRFGYSPEYFDNPAAHPISLSLPLEESPFGDVIARPFFQNLLPENDQLRSVIEREGLAPDDIVGLLEHLGSDIFGRDLLPAARRPADEGPRASWHVTMIRSTRPS